MELTPEYKRTEAGVIPEDWDALRLGDLCSFRTGPFGSALHRSDYTVGGVPIINPMHIIDGALAPTNSMTITVKAASQLSEYLLREGDLVIGRRGDMGRCAVVHSKQSGWLCGTGSMIVRPNSRVNSSFLQRILSSPTIVAKITDASVGSTMINLNQSVLRNISIQAPPVCEQRAIVKALDDFDELIASLNALIAKKRDLKQATMQQLLTGKIRLLDFNRVSRWRDSPVGFVPDDWQIVALRDVCTKIQDGTHFSPKLGGGQFLYLTSKNVGFGVLDLTQTERIGTVEHDKIYSRCDVRWGDLLLTKDGANTGHAAINTILEPFSLLSSVAFLRFDARAHNARYFLYQILSTAGQQRIKEQMSGNAITRLTLQKINALQFAAPHVEEQRAIAAVLDDMDAEIAALEARRDKTRGLKQGMMQELLTGRLRLR